MGYLCENAKDFYGYDDAKLSEVGRIFGIFAHLFEPYEYLKGDWIPGITLPGPH